MNLVGSLLKVTMSKIYTFIHFDAPIGKGRPKFVKDGYIGKDGKRHYAYTPSKTSKAEIAIAWSAKQAIGTPALTRPLAIMFHVFCKPPQSWSASKIKRCIENEAELPGKKPDIDNIIKLYCDALNNIAWVDDRQIVTCIIHKRYAWQNAVRVTFWEIPKQIELEEIKSHDPI